MGPDHSFIGASMRNRVLVIIGVIALSLWITHPIEKSLKLGLDLNGGVQLVLRVKTDAASPLRDQVVEQALRTIDRRVNELGVAEAVIARYTAADQILVQPPADAGGSRTVSEP
jgi:preprotein translocase subunit SecD